MSMFSDMMPNFGDPNQMAIFGALGNALRVGATPRPITGMGAGNALLGLVGAGMEGASTGATASQGYKSADMTNQLRSAMMPYQLNMMKNATSGAPGSMGGAGGGSPADAQFQQAYTLALASGDMGKAAAVLQSWAEHNPQLAGAIKQQQEQNTFQKTPQGTYAMPGQGSGTQMPAVTQPDATVPLGVRNNNPGNLTGGGNWQGMTGADSNGYLKFATPQDGLRAMAIDLKNQPDLHGLNTVTGIVSKYAPASAGNNTQAYISDVSKQLNVNPNAPLNLQDPQVLSALQSAMISHENGQQPYDPAMVNGAANTALQGGGASRQAAFVQPQTQQSKLPTFNAADGKPIVPNVQSVKLFKPDPSGTPKYNTENTETGVNQTKLFQADDMKGDGELTANLSSIVKEQYRLKQLSDVYKQMQSGTLLSQNPELANQLVAWGVIKSPDQIHDLAMVQKGLANQAIQIVQQIKDANANVGSAPTRTFGSEITNLMKKAENPGSQPEANYEVITDAMGLANHAADMAKGWDAIGGLGNRLAGGTTLRPSVYARQFIENHDVQDYKELAKKEIGPFKGMVSQSDFKTAEDVGAAYKAGKISKQQAVAILQKNHGMK